MAAARQPGIGAGFKQWQKSSEVKPRNSEPADGNGHRWRSRRPWGPHGQQGSKSSPPHPSADPWVGGGEGRAASQQLTTYLQEKTENYLKGSFKSLGLNELNTRLVI